MKCLQSYYLENCCCLLNFLHFFFFSHLPAFFPSFLPFSFFPSSFLPLLHLLSSYLHIFTLWLFLFSLLFWISLIFLTLVISVLMTQSSDIFIYAHFHGGFISSHGFKSHLYGDYSRLNHLEFQTHVSKYYLAFLLGCQVGMPKRN